MSEFFNFLMALFFGILAMFFVIELIYGEIGTIRGYLLSLISIALFLFFSCQFSNNVDQGKKQVVAEKQKFDAIWVKNHCPVIDTECGSKHKYACSKKVESMVPHALDLKTIVNPRSTC